MSFRGGGPVAVSTLGLRRLKADLAVVLGRPVVYRPPLALAGCSAQAGWGHKRSAGPARLAARLAGLPYLALEDGFLRSVRPGRGEASLSYVVDTQGIYTDASGPSDLIDHIRTASVLEESDLARARAGIALLRALKLSKYNAAPARSPRELGLDNAARRVLVVDQTHGDASIAGAQADAASFAAMLAAARRDNPGARIIVKLHPETVNGAKRGYLAGADLAGTSVLSEGVDPWSLIAIADRVYTVSSLLGFEALLQGLPVTCFGHAFYHGWGLTEAGEARADITRGRASREALFHAGYLAYGRYLDAWRRTPVSFEEAAEQLAFLKSRYHENQPTVCLGITPWKRRAAERFLYGPGDPPPHFEDEALAIAEARRRAARVVVWASRASEGLSDTAGRAGVSVHRLEDGFIRSIGLGAKLIPPASLVLDTQGIYYDPSRPSGFEEIAMTADFPSDLLARARALRLSVIAARLSKYNDGRRLTLDLPRAPYRVLVPGQVENDASIARGASCVNTNLKLLEAARARHPQAILIYKPHPDVASGLRPGAVPQDRRRALSDGEAEGWNMADLLDEIDRVETMTSLTGFEALMRGKPVATHGQPFYAGWGLTEDLSPPPRRTRRLSLDELIAVTLILYPRYIDPVSGRACAPELVIERFAAALAAGPPPPDPWRDAYARAVHGAVIPLARRLGWRR